MSTLIEPGIEIDSRKDEAALVVSSVSKAYRLWSSPKERFRYGLWNQIPGWGPKFLRRIADEKKAALGTELTALIRRNASVGSKTLIFSIYTIVYVLKN